ncbi:MAG: AAA family ATPase [Fimbriimonadaceae bacterium]|nr:AAA family ATPase [Fimbriimonadaceae bacterium]
MRPRRFVLTGGPGAGKTTVLGVLAERGFSVAPDSARAIIRKRREQGLSPRPGPYAFARAIYQADVREYDRHRGKGGPVFYDRGYGDVLGMLWEVGAVSRHETLRHFRARPMDRRVLYFPPWQAIYARDEERDQSFEEAVRVGSAVRDWYEALGFTPVAVSFGSPEQRADAILDLVLAG